MRQIAKEGKKYSDMMQAYLDLKKQYRDAIVLYRLGDFYEMFFDDAVKASKLLDLTLTGRDCGKDMERAPMCGVPYHAVDSYISRLIAAGEKVAICEQMGIPGEQKVMPREIVRVITPGTNTLEEMLDGTVNHYLTAVAKNKKDYAVASLDIVTGELCARVFADETLADTEDYLLGLNSAEIVAPSDICTESKTLTGVSCEKIVRFSPFYDYSFDYDTAKERIEKQYNVFSLEALGLENSGAAVNAVGGLLEYVMTTQKRSLSHISVPKILSDGNEMYLDYNTRRNLELTETLTDGKKIGSLLWVLDRTKTGMGARMLHNWTVRPLRELNSIEKRQGAVAELVKNTLHRKTLENVLSEIHDLERLTTKISYGNIMPRDCIALQTSLKMLPDFKKVIDKLRSDYFTEISSRYIDFSETVSLLSRAIKQDKLPATVKDGGYIADGYNEELDKYREMTDNAKGLIERFEAKQRERTGVQLKVASNNIFGYYIEISNAKRPEKLPEDYVRRQTVANGERYVTEELVKLDREIVGAAENALNLESKLYAELKEYLLSKVPDLKKIAFLIAQADCLCSLASVASDNKYVRPKMVASGPISIFDGRHPVVEALQKSNEFVPNDTELSAESPIAILTGPNMAGKSTYIRQVAIITLMAHIGSFVPASKAEIGLVDRIFTRVGASDNLVRGQSTFMVEMLEVANILNNATKDSLLILDEIGRGTSTLDGLSIAWAIVEHIALHMKSKTLFATHYHELSELEKLLTGVKNYRVLVQENAGGIAFLYKIVRGGANRSFGIEVASIAGVSKDITARAKDILSVLSETHELSGGLRDKMSQAATPTAIACDQLSMFPEDETFAEIKKILNGTDLNRCTPLEGLAILADLKKLLK